MAMTTTSLDIDPSEFYDNPNEDDHRQFQRHDVECTVSTTLYFIH
jgi:hypothetical protein